MKATCKDCPDRKPCCWSTCEKYKKFAEERQRINSTRLNESRVLYNERNRNK